MVGEKLVPVPSADPPVLAAYQLIIPEVAVAERLTTPVPHLEPAVTDEIPTTVIIDADEVTVPLQPLPLDTFNR